MRTANSGRQKKASLHFLPAVAFLLCITANAALAAPVLGDVNADTVINIVDALMVARYATKIPEPGIHPEVADVDGNKTVDIIDALIISKYDAGVIDFFPAPPVNWEAVQLYAWEGDAFKTALLNNGFVVLDSLPYDTITAAYTSFQENYEIPAFITTDSLLHLFHITFSHMLQVAEKQYLAVKLQSLLESLALHVEEEYAALPAGTGMKAAAAELRIFTAIACALINGENVLNQAENGPAFQEANLVLEKIYAHNEVEPFPGLDYTQFTPRGHYAGDAVLESYFRAVKWMQKRSFRIENPASPADAEIALLSAGILTGIINRYPVLADYWNSIDRFITGTLGRGNSITPMMVEAALLALFPAYPAEGYSLLSGQGNLSILQQALLTAEYPQEKRICFFAAPRLLDNASLADTVHPTVEGRFLPGGLDAAAAVFGSQTAYNILLPGQGASPAPDTQLKNQIDRLITEYAGLADADWSSSTYSSWFYTLRTLSGQAAPSAPRFMQGELWQREKLNTQLASWTELHGAGINLAPTPVPTPTPPVVPVLGDVNSSGRIDIVDALMVVQYTVGLNIPGFSTARADVNQDGVISIVDALMIAQYTVGLITQFPGITTTPPPGFVEPNSLFYESFKAMCSQVIAVIEASGFQLSHVDRFTNLYNYAENLRKYSEDLAAGKRLTDAGYEYIRKWGSTIKSFLAYNSFIPGYDPQSHSISDIFTCDEQILHVAVGKLHPVFVTYYVPDEIYPFAAVGFIMSYYEFTGDGVRFTDAQWKDKLVSSPPALAAWSSGFWE